MDRKAILILGIMALTVSGMGLAYAVLFTIPVHVTVTHTPTPAAITVSPTTIADITLGDGGSITKTITLHNSGETTGSVDLTLTVSPTTPVLPTTFSGGGTTKTVIVAGGANVTVEIVIGPAPSSAVDLSYTVTITGV